MHSLLDKFQNCQKERALFCASRNSVPGIVNSRLKYTYTILKKHMYKINRLRYYWSKSTQCVVYSISTKSTAVRCKKHKKHNKNDPSKYTYHSTLCVTPGWQHYYQYCYYCYCYCYCYNYHGKSSSPFGRTSRTPSQRNPQRTYC